MCNRWSILAGLLNPITGNQWREPSYRPPSRRTSRRILAYR